MRINEAEPRIILDAYRERVTGLIENAMLDTVRPKIREFAEQAARELKTQIEASFDQLNHEFLVRVSVDVRGAP